MAGERTRHAQTRIRLDRDMTARFLELCREGGAKSIQCRGIPYSLVYNLAHGRVRSISARDYRVIFGEDPPEQAFTRADGHYFRGMVRLWLYINDETSKAVLYKELHPGKVFRKVDHRIFNGEVKTVRVDLERSMESKFEEQGLEPSQIRQWIDELDRIEDEERVQYRSVKPALDYLRRTLGVSPSHFLNQYIPRYESGELKTIPKEVHGKILRAKNQADQAVRSGSGFALEKVREEIYGRKEGFTLYADVREELEFLRRHGGKSPRAYLGRSIGFYEKKKLKRIATWRAKRIREDFCNLIRSKCDIPLRLLPGSYRKSYSAGLIAAFRRLLASRMMEQGDSIENSVLIPVPSRMLEYRSNGFHLLGMHESAEYLGMSGKAFDMMVASIPHVIKKVGRYDGGWYIREGYLKDIVKNARFTLVRDKYEWMARH